MSDYEQDREDMAVYYDCAKPDDEILLDDAQPKTYMAKYRVTERCLYPEKVRLMTNTSRRKTGYHKRKNRQRRKLHPGQVRAQRAFNYAVESGRLVRPTECSQCHVPCKPQGHHPDYSKPLEVLWLCIDCHRKIHGMISHKWTAA